MAAGRCAPHCRIAVATGLPDPFDALVLRLWLAYFLPQHDWYEAQGANVELADYVYGYQLERAPPDLGLVLDGGAGGMLYRTRRSGA